MGRNKGKVIKRDNKYETGKETRKRLKLRAGSKMTEEMQEEMGGLWKRIEGARLSGRKGLGKCRFQTFHFESSDVLTDTDDCGGNYIPRPSWTCISSCCNKQQRDEQLTTAE